MDKWDYAAAAIGLVPVAGNIASKLGSGARVLATELRSADVYLKNRPQYEYGIELIGSEAGGKAIDTGYSWLNQQYESVSNTVISSLPQTAAYVAAGKTH